MVRSSNPNYFKNCFHWSDFTVCVLLLIILKLTVLLNKCIELSRRLLYLTQTKVDRIPPGHLAWTSMNTRFIKNFPIFIGHRKKNPFPMWLIHKSPIKKIKWFIHPKWVSLTSTVWPQSPDRQHRTSLRGSTSANTFIWLRVDRVRKSFEAPYTRPYKVFKGNPKTFKVLLSKSFRSCLNKQIGTSHAPR